MIDSIKIDAYFYRVGTKLLISNLGKKLKYNESFEMSAYLCTIHLCLKGREASPLETG